MPRVSHNTKAIIHLKRAMDSHKIALEALEALEKVQSLSKDLKKHKASDKKIFKKIGRPKKS